MFEEKLDGKILAKKVAPYWEAGGKSLDCLSEVVECNFAFKIPDVLRQIKNALQSFPEEAPDWVKDVCGELAKIHKRLQSDSVAKCLREYSTLLEEKKLITQAVITLQMAIETAITEKYASTDFIGDYDWWQEYGDDFYKNERRALSREDSDALKEIEHLRNAIAHGGNRYKETKEYPSTANLPGLWKRGNKAADNLFARLGNGA
jgi:hypothetical protein